MAENESKPGASSKVWRLSEGYALALLPAFAFFCVQRYEAGRFGYLGVPTEFIDLTILRLIGGGTALLVFAVVLYAALRWGREFLAAKTGWRRFVGYLLISLVLFGIPQYMQASTRNALIWATILTLCFALSASSGDERSDEVKGEGRLEPLGFLFFVGMVAVLIYSLGFFVERMSINRLCLTDEPSAFVVAMNGESAVLKRVKVGGGELLPGVSLQKLGDETHFQECRLVVKGEPSLFDRSFAPRSANDLQD